MFLTLLCLFLGNPKKKMPTSEGQEVVILTLIVLREITGRMLKMAHQRCTETGLEQWRHDPKWNNYCPLCKAREEMALKLEVN